MPNEFQTFLFENRSRVLSAACDQAAPALSLGPTSVVDTLDTLIDGLFHDMAGAAGPHPVYDTDDLPFDDVERVCRLHLALRRAILRRIRKTDFQGSGFESLEFAAERRLDDQLTGLVKRCAETGRLEYEKRERARSAHFATINDIAQMSLTTLDPNEILRRVVIGVRERFDYYHVSIYLIDNESAEAVMRARSGAYEGVFPEGYRTPFNRGIVGTVVATGDAVLSNDVDSDPRRVLAFPEESESHAELCVPIRAGENVIGALDVLSSHRFAFSDGDRASLEVLAGQVAWVLHNARLYQETRQLKEFHDRLLESIPVPVVLLDTRLNVEFANNAYLQSHELASTDLIGRRLDEVRPDSFLASPEGRAGIEAAFRTGQVKQLERVTLQVGQRRPRIVNLVVTRVDRSPEAEPLALVVVEDISDSVEKAYESSLLRQIGQTTNGILDLDRLIYAILTCVTAGTALGFNRAAIFLVDDQEEILRGKLVVGPSSREEASQIWADLAGRNPSVEEILTQYDTQQQSLDTPLCRAVKSIDIPLGAPDDVLAWVVRNRQTVRMSDSTHELAVGSALWSALETLRFAAVPLIGKNRVVGVIVADNAYNDAPITNESIDLLEAFAGHAALAIENAALYAELEDKVREIQHAQKELLQSERLAVIGQMSARIAHEIRNPLAVIGGFARSLLRKPEPQRVESGAGVIVDEVSRLEKLLNETLDFTRTAGPVLADTDLNFLISDVLDFFKSDTESSGVELRRMLGSDLQPASVDSDQIRQVLVNIIRNGLQAMPDGGSLAVASGCDADVLWIEVADTGEGMSDEQMENIFNPFFTTKTHGTGLGLVVSRKIVEDHGGSLLYRSEIGSGTVARIELPARRSSH